MPSHAEAAIADPAHPVAHRTLWSLLYDGHVRLSDALSLDVRDVDLNARTARVDFPKTGDPYLAPLSARSADLVRSAVGDRREGPLLTTDADMPISRERAAQFARQAGVSIHDFRTSGRLRKRGTPAEGADG
ncbi:tyrosine-type recombinase/integrase [Streptomyces sp. NPDC001142]